jgi:hypothetical protein
MSSAPQYYFDHRLNMIFKNLPAILQGEQPCHTRLQTSKERAQNPNLLPISKTLGGLDREGMISVAAYFHAEHRGFAGGGDALADWLAAEAEIDAMLNSSQGVKAH